MTLKTQSILFASVLATMMLVPIGFGAVSADVADEIAENERKIEEFRV